MAQTDKYTSVFTFRTAYGFALVVLLLQVVGDLLLRSVDREDDGAAHFAIGPTVAACLWYAVARGSPAIARHGLFGLFAGHLCVSYFKHLCVGFDWFDISSPCPLIEAGGEELQAEFE